MPTLPSNATRDSARAKHERIQGIVLELDLDRCTLTWGVAPCTASGSTRCYNTRATCQDKANYARGTKTYRFCARGMPVPPGELVRPYISEADGAVSEIDPEAGLGRRSTLTLDLVDEPDSDLEQDPYPTTRAQPAQGTFWARLIARNPNMAGRTARVRRGYVVTPWSWDTFLDELYIIDRVDGPGRDGRVTLTLKDPLKLADRSRVPVPTDGKLASELKAYATKGITVSASSTTISLEGDAPATDDALNGFEVYITGSQGMGQRRTITDYVGATRQATISPAWLVTPGSSSPYEVSALSLTLGSGKGNQYADPATSGKREFVRIGEEIIEYTAKSGDTLSWPASTHRAAFGTPRKDHNSNTQVQLCRAFISHPVTDVVLDLLEEGGIATALINTSALSAAEGEFYGDVFRISACLSEPVAANELLADLLPQIGAVIWWSPQTQRAEFKVLAPQLALPIAWTDAASLIDGSVEVEALEELRLTYGAMYYGHLNATSNRSEAKNFALGEIVVDADAESAAEYGDRRAKVVYSRWFQGANQLAAQTWVARLIAGLRDAPRKLQLRLDPKDYTIPAGELADIATRRLTDETGAPKTTRCLVTRVVDRGTHIEVQARTTGFGRRYGFIAPNGTANYPTDSVYAHVTQNNGLMGNGDAGFLIF